MTDYTECVIELMGAIAPYAIVWGLAMNFTNTFVKAVTGGRRNDY